MRAREESGFPSHTTIGRFGSMQELATALAAYCDRRPGSELVAAICRERTELPARAMQSDGPPSDDVFGFVYLMRSGRYYKIGKSNAAGRRERELATQMPEKLTTVHVIKTDDPSGIEAYWHRRFKAKRKNGEWFDLGAEDIRAFKRRKFM